MAASVDQSELDPGAKETVDPAVLQEIGAWVGQFVRALKTCRLYDAANPTVVRVREELAGSLSTLLGQRGAVQLQVGAHALSYAGHELQTNRSGDDNLAPVLHRDGIRLLVLEPGIEPRELESLLDLILDVTGLSAGDDDLVTLLWDADLPHVTIDTVPLEGEVDGGFEENESDRARGAAWPRQGAGEAPPPAAEAPAQGKQPPGGLPDAGTASAGATSRSDDCTTGEGPADIEQAFDQLETSALSEIARFQQECERARHEPVPAMAIRILEDCFAGRLTPADHAELAAFIPGVLRETLGLGDWQRAGVALTLLRSSQPDWPVQEFCQELCGPLAITTRRVVVALDRHDEGGIESFLALARQLGTPAADWLMHVLAGSEQKNVRRPLARVIAELSAGQAETVLPWLSDRRWFVVRNAVHILGWIGGEVPAEYFRVPSEHPEMRVRQEVIAALSQVDSDGARPILTAMLRVAEPPIFVAILHRLALDAHASVQDMLLDLLRDESFVRRSEPERRALLGTLATRGDAVVPALEAELNGGGGWLARRPDPDHTAIALCLARIGTPTARAVLERGLASGRKNVQRACRIAGASGEVRDE